jgi:hypothetical protein
MVGCFGKWTGLGGVVGIALLVGCGEKSNSAPGPSGGSGGASSGGKASGGVSGAGATQGGAVTSGGDTTATSGGNAASTGGEAGSGGNSSAGHTGGAAAGNAGQMNQGGKANPNEDLKSVDALKPIVDAYCAAARACCTRDAMPMQLANCEDLVMSRFPAKSIANGATRIDADALALCRAAYETAVTSCEATPVIEACRNVLIGTHRAEEPCTLGAQECELIAGQGTCLLPSSDEQEGVCKYPAHGKAGDPCMTTCHEGQRCLVTREGPSNTVLTMCFESDGVFCDFSKDVALCAPMVDEGATCPFDDACGSTSHCAGTCRPAAELGEDCEADCRRDLTCVNGKCEGLPFANGSICIGYTFGP